jgi:hypothetical protein
MNDKKREAFIARYREKRSAPPDEPLEATRKFLMSYVVDRGDMKEIEEPIAYMATVNTITLCEGLAGMEALLADPPQEPNVLRNLIVIEVGRGLKDDSDEGAKALLRELVELVRRYLPPSASGSGDAAP